MSVEPTRESAGREGDRHIWGFQGSIIDITSNSGLLQEAANLIAGDGARKAIPGSSRVGPGRRG